MYLWTLLCALVSSHVGTARGHPQAVPTELEASNWQDKFIYITQFAHKTITCNINTIKKTEIMKTTASIGEKETINKMLI